MKLSIVAAIAVVSCLAGCGAPEGSGQRGARPDSVASLPDKSAGVVEVLNGTGRRGAANRVAELLRTKGFDVVKVGNAPESNHSRTIVAERRAAPRVASEVAKAVGARGYFPFHNENLLVDATVFVGRDFEEILPP